MDYELIFSGNSKPPSAKVGIAYLLDLERKACIFSPPLAARHHHPDVAVKSRMVCERLLGMGTSCGAECLHEVLEICGACAGGTRNSRHKSLSLLTGLATSNLHHKAAALLFTSGYVSNMASAHHAAAHCLFTFCRTNSTHAR